MGQWEENFKKKQKSNVNINIEKPKPLNIQTKNDDIPTGSFKKLQRSIQEIWENLLLENEEKFNTIMFCRATNIESSTFVGSYLSMYLASILNVKIGMLDISAGYYSENSFIPIDLGPIENNIISESGIELCIVPSTIKNLSLLHMAGSQKDKIRNLNIFTKESCERIIKLCKSNFDMTVICSQPITFNPSMVELAKWVDKIVLVCRYGQSRREVSKTAIDKLNSHKIRISGVILYDREFPIPTYIYNLMK